MQTYVYIAVLKAVNQQAMYTYRHMSYKVCVTISCWSMLLDVCIM